MTPSHDSMELSILIMAPDRAQGESIADFIKQFSFTQDLFVLKNVKVVDDYQEALTFCSDTPPSLLITIVDGKQGWEFCQQVRNDPDMKHFPIIVLGESEAKREQILAKFAGVDKYLSVNEYKDNLVPSLIAILSKIRDRRATTSARQRIVLSGNLAAMPLLEVLQILSTAYKTGCLHLQGRDLKAKIYLENGLIRHAEMNEYRGKEAFLRILMQESGSFKFNEPAGEYEATLLGETMPLLLDSMQILDERQRIKDFMDKEQMAEDFPLVESLLLSGRLDRESVMEAIKVKKDTGQSLQSLFEEARLVKPGETARRRIPTSSPATTKAITGRTDPRLHRGRLEDMVLQRLIMSFSLLSMDQMNECLGEKVTNRMHGATPPSLYDIILMKGYLDHQTLSQLSLLQDDTGANLIPGYSVVEKIGEGALSVVYRAIQDSLQRPVAIKVFVPNLADSEENIKRFLREAEIVSRLDHPNIVKAIDFGHTYGLYYFIMEFIQGQTIHDYIKSSGPIPEKECLDIIHSVAQGMVHIWSQGIVHRDLKSHNIIRLLDGKVKICDLGLAKGLGNDDINITAPGVVLGTPEYMAPEAFVNPTPDFRADVYSLGVTLYEMATGRRTFSCTTRNDIMMAQINMQPQDPRTIVPSLSKEFSLLVLKLLDKNPINRCEEPRELLADIEAVQQGKPPKRLPPKLLSSARRIGPKILLLAACLLLCVLLLGAFLWWQQTHPTANSNTNPNFQVSQLLHQADEYFKSGTNALAMFDYENARRFFDKALEDYTLVAKHNSREGFKREKADAVAMKWLQKAQELFNGQTPNKFTKALQCCRYGLVVPNVSPFIKEALVKLQNNMQAQLAQRQRQQEQAAREQALLLIEKGDQYVKYARNALALSDYENANRFFSEAVISYSLADKQAPKMNVAKQKIEVICLQWLDTVQQLMKSDNLTKLQQAYKCCKYGLFIQGAPPLVRQSLQELQQKIQKKLTALQKRTLLAKAFKMRLRRLWLNNTADPKSKNRHGFDVQDNIYLHVTLQLENYNPEKSITCHYEGGYIRTTTQELPRQLPVNGQYHWCSTVLFKKKHAGQYTLNITLQCDHTTLSRKISFSLKKLASDLVYLGENEQGYEEYQRDRDQMIMILIPAGNFTMGDPTEEGYVDEQRHTVFLDSFLIDKYEVSNQQYARFLNWWNTAWNHQKRQYDWISTRPTAFRDNGNHIPKYWHQSKYNKPSCPVVGVDWFDAYAYARWANRQSARGVSCLPSEAQWEKAAAWDAVQLKARVYPWGNTLNPEKANYASQSELMQPVKSAHSSTSHAGQHNRKERLSMPVTSYPTGISHYGLYNMAGNVGEWCQDWYHRKYYLHAPRRNPVNQKPSKSKVFRGGSFNSTGWEIRNSRRHTCNPSFQTIEVGFRCVRSIP